MRNPWRRSSYMKENAGLGLIGCGFMVFGILLNLAFLAAAIFVIAKVSCWVMPGIPWC